MSSHDEQVLQRQSNLAELGKLGVEVYPRTFERQHTISALVDAHGQRTHDELEAEHVTTITSGRILAIRAFGKANFLVLSDGHAKIQAYVRQDALPELDFKIYKLLDFGDWVGVEGRLFRTKTNELTIWATRLHFLAKCLVPLPEKWHGLTDVEIRYRQRYLDLIVNPDSRRVFETRSRIVSGIRDFMTARGYLEVETPMMQPIAGGAIARPFVTHHNTLDMALYLRIAPELYLKRLVVGGLEKVFEINRNFRNEGISTQHNPEFTMMEFYEAYADYHALMRMTEEMISTVATQVLGTDQVTFGDHEISLKAPFVRLSLREAAREAASRKLSREVTDADLRDRGRVAAIAAALGLEVDPGYGAGKITTEIFERLCEDRLIQPTFVLRLPNRGLAAVEAATRRSRHRRAVRALHRRLRGGQRLQRAQRSGRAAAPVRRAAPEPRRRRPRGARDGRGLHPRARVRAAADRRRRGRHRPAGDAADQQPVDSRRHSVPADEDQGVALSFQLSAVSSRAAS